MEWSTLTTIFDTSLAVVFTWVAYKTGQIIWKYTPYSYPNARIRAMEARLLTDQRFSELAESKSLQNFVVSLEDTDYGKRLTSLQSYNIEDVERALDLSLVDVIELMVKIMPKRIKGLFEIMLEEWDVRNIINVVKAKLSNMPPQDFIMPAGKMLQKVKAMAEAKTMEEMLVILEGTDYEEPLRRLLLNEITLQEFELELYKVHYSKLLRYVNSRKGEEKIIASEFVNMLIDYTNISTLLRAKLSSLAQEDIRKLIIPGGTLSKSTIEAMINSEDVVMALGELEGTKYGEVLREVREAVESGNIESVEIALRKYILRRMKELSQFYPLSVAVAVAYLLQKESEVRKLKAIAKLIEDGVKPEKIKEMVGELA
ncbi:V-type ATP synthase subunit C [Pyrococcus abyssi]|uniref:A-type ATP synthase subunit C n=1 Tax=Pyrococcus abyssi (strain GE5 / Orsay) TaxID=272844 RepID=AATC_PYRAB|nr:V-type ATP synthase subunit C [Pyrococcus abyssi]Q9UXU5.1 RecName: Full=V-type ATP synthase subunit C; AltName: Full=V-ATPase subunit C [Pyrococcus abyssi GE5]CAB50668.1 atpC archaeal/vacuolar-type H+-transporting ATP synthase, subunit C [Pyrococcus abyssi GE5]CCE71237.1 TPA: V-type ATP synthase subunit C [Pyrococcus abyssi GE5]